MSQYYSNRPKRTNGCPAKSVVDFLPTTFPDIGMFCLVQCLSICRGILSFAWACAGASMKTTARPDSRCHYVILMGNQSSGRIRECFAYFDVTVCTRLSSVGERLYGEIGRCRSKNHLRKNQTPGLSALKRIVADPPGGTMTVSRL